MTWVVFRDSDGACPVRLRELLLKRGPGSPSGFALRIAHTMTEAWLLADRDGFAQYFRVSPARLPREPEEVPHAKQALLNLCSRSTSRRVRNDVVTEDRKTGPLYVHRINEFAATAWNVGAAAANSPSLARALAAIRRLPA